MYTYNKVSGLPIWIRLGVVDRTHHHQWTSERCAVAMSHRQWVTPPMVTPPMVTPPMVATVTVGTEEGAGARVGAGGQTSGGAGWPIRGPVGAGGPTNCAVRGDGTDGRPIPGHQRTADDRPGNTMVCRISERCVDSTSRRVALVATPPLPVGRTVSMLTVDFEFRARRTSGCGGGGDAGDLGVLIVPQVVLRLSNGRDVVGDVVIHEVRLDGPADEGEVERGERRWREWVCVHEEEITGR